MDCLIVSQLAAGQSAYNPIEHAWGGVNGTLVGQKLSACLPGQPKPPKKMMGTYSCTQDCMEQKAAAKKGLINFTKATQKKAMKKKQFRCLVNCMEARAKFNELLEIAEKKVFCNAADDLKNLWKDQRIMGYMMTCTVEYPTRQSDAVIKENATIEKYFKTSSLKNVLNSTEMSELHSEVCEMHRHMPVKSLHLCCWQTCGYAHCALPRCRIPSTQISDALMFMRTKQAPFLPTIDKNLLKSYKTYLFLKLDGGDTEPAVMEAWDMYILRKWDKEKTVLCTLNFSDPHNCCGSYSFNSVSDADRHVKLYHKKINTVSTLNNKNLTKPVRPARSTSVRCRQIMVNALGEAIFCNMLFDNYYQFSAHAQREGHMNMAVQRASQPYQKPRKVVRTSKKTVDKPVRKAQRDNL